MDKDLLKKFSEVYPLNVRPYEQYIDDTDNTSSIEKINAMIQNLHHIGRLTNGVVEQWNTVMKWVVDNGLESITSDILEEKLNIALNTDLKDLTTTVADEQINKLMVSGQFETIVESAINNMHENIQGSLNGFATQLAETDAESKRNSKRNSGFISLKEYCSGDGVADDTQGFLNAVQYAKINKKALYVDGHFLIKQGIVIENNTIPEIYGSNRDTSILDFDIESGYAIETKNYYAKPLRLRNLTIKQKNLTKLSSGLKVSFEGWGGAVLAENINIFYFTENVLTITDGFNSNFTNCEFQGGIQNGVKVATLLKIEQTGGVFSNNNLFTGCTFVFGKIGIQSKGAGTNYTFNNSNFEHLSLVMHITHSNMLTPRFNFISCWFENFTKGIINADMNESTLIVNTPITNKASILNFRFTNNYDGGLSPTYFLDNIVEPDLYTIFRATNGIPIWTDLFTLPLLNGWTGTVQYRKNNLGQVHVTANINVGTRSDGTIIGTLPIGYRPAQHQPVISYDAINAKVINGILIASSGDIIVKSPATTDMVVGTVLRINAILQSL